MKILIYLLIFSWCAFSACASFGAGGKAVVPDDAICAWVDWGAGRRTYICASPSEWATINHQAVLSRELDEPQ